MTHAFTPDDHAELDRICDEFAQARGADESPRIEDYLAQVDDRLRMALLEELIAQEVDLRRASGEKVEIQEYLDRFPDHHERVKHGFALAPERPDKAGEISTQSLAKGGDSNVGQPAADEGEMPTEIDRYHVKRRLGAGQFGAVYLAHDPLIDRMVAIKLPHPDRIGSEEDIASYVEEATNAAKVNHPGIVQIHDVQHKGTSLYIVLQYIEGQSLAELLEGSDLVRCSAELMIAIADAVGHANQHKLVHRDLKPANILIDTQGQPHVADFGLAIHESVQRNRERHRAGSAAYMSPEQVRFESHHLDGRSDVWALGVILYEMLAGSRPFGGKPSQLLDEIQFREHRPLGQTDQSIPAELDRICAKCLEKRISDRYRSAFDFANDLRHWLESPEEQPVAVSKQPPETVSNPPRVIPKGLRSYDAGDADFFLELLPGPRDRDGLPESIRFWKSRVETTESDETFAVGVMYGPSGCGKSSLLKAGLLPRLDEHVAAVSIEATAADTEVRLLKGLKKHLPYIATDRALPEILAVIREQGLGGGRKLLLVIDQFEQWLHAHGGEATSQLLHSLRQCDGGNVQCLVLVREEYTMPCLRFLDGLDTEMREGENFGVVDLFDQRHSRKVLRLFGEAHEALSDDRITPEEEQFVEHSVQQLADDKGRVICVRLALYAEMVKDKSWVPSTLQDVGGAEGIGRAFLEETLSAETAKPTHRPHVKKAERVLKALLPPSEAESIKGSMRSYEDLYTASKCKSTAEFASVIALLDEELRLITPTDPEGQEQEEENSDTESRAKHYQLTHDYLVPSLRRWLTQKQSETRRGRAELRLAERAGMWKSKREDRQLPSTMEYARIRLLVPSSGWSDLERSMMKRAERVLRKQCAVVSIALLGLIIAGAIYRQVTQRDIAKGHVTNLLAIPPEGFGKCLKLVRQRPSFAIPMLREALEHADSSARVRLHAACALRELGVYDFRFPFELISTCDTTECPNIIHALSVGPDDWFESVSEMIEESDETIERAPREVDRIQKKIASVNAEEASDVEEGNGTDQGSLEEQRQALTTEVRTWGQRAEQATLDKSRLAIVALHLSEKKWAEDMLKSRADPIQRTVFIKMFSEWHGDLERLADLADDWDHKIAANADFLSGIALAVGSANAIEDTESRWAVLMRCWWQNHPSGGVHGASQWSLEKAGMPPVLQSHNEYGRKEDRDWYVLKKTRRTMVKIPLSDSDEGLNSLWMSDREIDIDLFQDFATAELPGWSGPYAFQDVRPEERLWHPVQNVSWVDAVRFCNWLSKREKRKPCYEEPITDSAEPDMNKDGFRLPTAAEWMRACRAGAVTDFFFGNDESYLGDYAYYKGNGKLTTHVTGEKMCNAWGLFDMHGNVWEFCGDQSARGGSFFALPVACSSRANMQMSKRVARELGFRVVSSE